MPFTLSISPAETCTGLDIVDDSGIFGTDGNTTGYGVSGGPANPAAWTSYLFSMWYPKSDLNAPADYTIQLAGITPVLVGTNYVWSVSLDDLGLTVLKSGTYYTTVLADNGTVYAADAEIEPCADISGLIDKEVIKVDPNCECTSGCEDPLRLLNLLRAATCGGECSGDQYQTIVDYLYSRVPQCC